jgi:hypothetical protein
MSAAEPMIETTLAAGQSGNSAANGHDVWRQDAPPMSGARLGRDPSGKPGWYVEDPEQQGKYKLVSSL